MKLLMYIRNGLRDTCRALNRHKGMMTLAMATVFVTLLTVGAMTLVGLNTLHIKNYVENEIEMNVFIKNDATTQDIQRLEKVIQKIDGVETSHFIDKAEALHDLSNKFGENSPIMDSLGEDNPLPSSFRVAFSDVRFMKPAADTLSQEKAVDEVIYGSQMVEKVLSFNKTFGILSGIFAAVMAIIVITLIHAMIRMTVLNRKEEIAIMKHIGATHTYINLPFFLEGMWIGFVGALLACVALYFGYNEALDYIRASTPFMPVVELEDVGIYVGGSLLVIGLLLGALGSKIAVKKYLKR